MKIEQIYTGCLAQGAYYIESNGEAVVIDPLREVDPYIQKAKRNNASIKYVLETHFHADFVSGHLDLAKKTGATIVYGPTAKPSFKAHIATDGETFTVGELTFKVLHTPGHTMESSCYLLMDGNNNEIALFTGDTLFIGDVGRPDLAQEVDASLTQEVLAGYLFDSLRNKIMPLPDELIIYPAHGAGSACGKKMSQETTDTLGHQKKTNYALNSNLTKAEFIKEVLTGLDTPPQYFPANVKMNIEGYEAIDEVVERGMQALNPDAFEAVANETGALILDTRNAEDFAKGFVPNAINIGIDGNFAPWVGSMIPDIKQQLLIVADEGREEEVVIRLARVGYDHAIGFLQGSYNAWAKAGKETDHIQRVSADELAGIQQKEKRICIIDVRKESEYNTEHVQEADNAPLDDINDSMHKINKEEPCYVHCASGYRSMIFVSTLRARGFHHLVDVRGGFKALKNTGKFTMTTYANPIEL